MNGIRVGRIAGIEISLNWSVLVLCTYLTWTLAAEVFAKTNPHLSAQAHLAMAVAATAGVVLSLLLHELGHAVVARREGMEIDGITLWIFGGVARFKRSFPNGKVELRVAFAGPLVTLVLAALFTLVALAQPPQAVAATCAWLGYLNASLFVFNMLPALPLDGGQVLHALLWLRGHDDLRAMRRAADVGRFFGILFLSAGAAVALGYDGYTGLWLAITGVFLFQGADAEVQYAQRRQSLSGVRVRDLMTRTPVTLDPRLTVHQAVDELALLPRHHAYPVAADGTPSGLLEARRLQDVPHWQWDERQVTDVMRDLDDVPVLEEDDEAVDAMTELGSSGSDEALVVAEGRLVGVLSLRDLSRAAETRR